MVMRLLACAVIWLSLAGCASVETQARFEFSSQYSSFPLVWPSVDVPRYQYLGDIIGEQNFHHEYVQQSTMARFWQWLIGEADKLPKQLARPQGLAVDGEGRLYVSDVGSAAVLMFDTKTNQFAYWGTENGRAFQSPVGLAIKDNSLLVADSEAACIWELDRLSGKLLKRHEFNSIAQPVGLAWAANRRQWFISDAQNHSIHMLDENLAYAGLLANVPELNRPTFLAYRDGQLLIADTLAAKVYRLSLDSGELLSLGQRGDRVGNLNRPKGVAFDGAGRIYVVESYFDHLLIFNQQGEFLLPIGGSGAEPGNFMLPSGVVVDGQNRVYVSDMLNGRVTVFQYLGTE
ncbi:6-bladed beta-propeller [Shewanella cyperi]|uniref:6-bladed beta-propeller n=1 Tax=Shewanella cyperi TaxID=2814292 RepID=A0A975AKT5_9GAMM|nr:6-bladed beta-propeller [Shewanella cyperi]QSX30495.1 6-bladed beta-propeller [Shewanella cyperi]QSX41274.1 6-bladed beta-propeller [Shewanella cyperi]